MNAQRDLGSVVYIPVSKPTPWFFFVFYNRDSLWDTPPYVDAAVCSHDLSQFLGSFHFEFPDYRPFLTSDEDVEFDVVFHMDSPKELTCWLVVHWRVDEGDYNVRDFFLITSAPGGGAYAYSDYFFGNRSPYYDYSGFANPALISKNRLVFYFTAYNDFEDIPSILAAVESNGLIHIVRTDSPNMPPVSTVALYYRPAPGNTRYLIVREQRRHSSINPEPEIRVEVPGYGSYSATLYEMSSEALLSPPPPRGYFPTYRSAKSPEGNLEWAVVAHTTDYVRPPDYTVHYYHSLVYGTNSGSVGDVDPYLPEFRDKCPLSIVNGMIVWAPFDLRVGRWRDGWHNRMLLWSPETQQDVEVKRKPWEVLPEDLANKLYDFTVITPTPYNADV